MAVVGINYSEGKKKNLDYKSVRISYNFNKNEKIFDSGDFVRDWYDCNKFIIFEMSDSEPIANSSSVNHFIMDGAPFISAYLKPKDKNNIDWFLDYEYDFQYQGIEFFVNKGTKPTWEELKDYCK